MGECFIIQIPHVSLFNPNQFLLEVNDQLKELKKEGRANILFRTIRSLDRNVETGKWYIEGDLGPEDGDIEEDPEMQANRMRELDNYDCALDLPGLDVLLAGPLQDAKKNIITHPRYIPLLQIAQLVENVKGWSKARGILDNGVWYTQATKMYEEDGEGAMGVGKNKRNLIIDGVGDMIVVLVNLMELSGMSANGIPMLVDEVRRNMSDEPRGNAHRLFHKMRLHTTLAVDCLWDITGVDSPKRIANGTIEHPVLGEIVTEIAYALSYADSLAKAYEFTLEQALSLAWDEIKDRRGYLNSDGIFVKESDMTNEEKSHPGYTGTANLVNGKLEDLQLTKKEDPAETKGETVNYFPIVVTTDAAQAVIDLIKEMDPSADSIQITQAGVYYGGNTQYPKPHVRFDYACTHGKSYVISSHYEEGTYQLQDDAACYQVTEIKPVTE